MNQFTDKQFVSLLKRVNKLKNIMEQQLIKINPHDSWGWIEVNNDGVLYIATLDNVRDNRECEKITRNGERKNITFNTFKNNFFEVYNNLLIHNRQMKGSAKA